jgi:hypothetical protein
MALYIVERNLEAVAPEQLRLEQEAVAVACSQLNGAGKQVRYISSVMVPTDGRGLDLFGAQSAETIKQAHAIAHVAYARIVEILDLTPGFLQPTTSRSRDSLKRLGGSTTGGDTTKGIGDIMTESAPPELVRWLTDGQRFFGMCLELIEKADRLQARTRSLEAENEMFREEIARLRHRADLLQNERSDMIAAFNDLAGHVTQVVDHILQKSENGEDAEKDLG